MLINLKDQIIIVTGASSGIGEATAWALSQVGATVVLAARRENRLRSLSDKINNSGVGRALAVKTDVTKPHELSRLVSSTVQAYGRIDVLLNIAGWGSYDWFEKFSQRDLKQQFEVNIVGLAELTRLVVPFMKSQRSGHIINMASYASRVSVPPLTVYASTKYAVEGLTDGLRRELAPWNIHVSRVHPGSVSGTEFNQKAKDRGGVEYKSIPIGRVSREYVASKIIRLIRNPQAELFIGRIYDIPVFINRHYPQLVDWFYYLWVYLKRRREITTPKPPKQKR